MQSKEKKAVAAQLWHLPFQPATTFASIGYEDFHFAPHFHEHYVIMLVEKGINLGRQGRERYDVSAGEMLLIQPGEMHTGHSFEGKALRYLAFYPDPASVGRWLEQMEFCSTRIPDFNLKYRNPVLSKSFRHLMDSVSADVNERLETETALLDFFAALLAAQPGGGGRKKSDADSQKFRQAEAFIRGNFAENFSLAALAAAAETSPFHLIRLFRQHSGLTPFDYLRSVRVEQAKGLMRQNASLTEVAYQAGFYDQSHFIRSFKNHTGFLPSDFRSRSGLVLG